MSIKSNIDENAPTTLSPIKDGAWLARELLTPSEQNYLREKAIANGMPPAAKDDRLRTCSRTEFMDEDLAQQIWTRLQGLVPERVVVDEDGEEIGLPATEPILYGTWRACGVNPMFRIVKYAGDGVGHFGPHRDGAFEKSLGERSLLTINGYLNELPKGVGGCTRFVNANLEIQTDNLGRFTTPESAVQHRVRPEAGAAVVFFHGLMHDGEPLAVGAPPKWLFRTEVMYRRDASSIAAEDVEARRLDVMAESIERVNAMAAMELNRISLMLNERRMTAEEARRRVAQWMQKFAQDEALMEELEEEISNFAQTESSQSALDAPPTEGDVCTPQPRSPRSPCHRPRPAVSSTQADGSQRATSRPGVATTRGLSAQAARQFVGRPVRDMDEALKMLCG